MRAGGWGPEARAGPRRARARIGAHNFPLLPLQTVLKGIEEAKAKGVKGPALDAAAAALAGEHVAPSTDALGHFVLRLAFCRTEDLRRWFLTLEADLFRARFRALLPDAQAAFISSASLPVTPLSRPDYDALRPALAAVAEGVHGGAASRRFAADVASGAARDAFFRARFEDVPDLVATRRALLIGGDAIVSKHDASSLVAGAFRARLAAGLTRAARAWASHGAAAEAGRLAPVVESLAVRYVGTDYGATGRGRPGDAVAAGDVAALAAASFPLCMRAMHGHVTTAHHLKHKGRLQLGLFLKGIGLPLDEALRFWRAAFAPKCTPDEFDKRHAYSIRFNYGREGKRADYTPYSCVKLITTPVDGGDCAGCPYKTLAPDALADALAGMGVAPAAVREAGAKAKAGHFQLACAAAWEGIHGAELDAGVQHPNQYYDASRAALAPKKEEGEGVKAEAGGAAAGAAGAAGAAP